MTVYQIAYDMKGSRKDRKKVEKAIQELGASIQVFDSTWFVDTEKDHDDIRDKLQERTSRRKEILVTELQGTWAASNIDSRYTDWLKEHR